MTTTEDCCVCGETEDDHDRPIHPQVRLRGLGIEVDTEIVPLIRLLHWAEIFTFMSCQDNNHSPRQCCGTARRVWVDVAAEDIEHLLNALNRPGELADPESLSARMVPTADCPGDHEYWQDRAWHIDLTPMFRADDGYIFPPGISVRFPYTDLAEVCTRLRSHIRRQRTVPD